MPWYATGGGRVSIFSGLAGDTASASGLMQAIFFDRWWLLPMAVFLGAPFFVAHHRYRGGSFASVMLFSAIGGLVWLLAQGFAIGLNGWEYDALSGIVGPLVSRQESFGFGAMTVLAVLLFYLAQGIAARGLVNGDVFLSFVIVMVVASVAILIMYPLTQIFVSALRDMDGAISLTAFQDRLIDRNIWSLGCMMGGGRCGSAWNSLWLATATGVTSTLLGLAFALVVTRTGFPMRRSLRVLTVLPIITPPFVIGLALILLFGRAGVVSDFLYTWFDIPPSRWLYGFTGVWLAQVLSFTPIAFLVLIGVVEGVSPSMEEAAQTLRANRWQTFVTVTLPLVRPGLANAFLLCFIESLADFGNPMVLGGRYDVLSTEIFFAIVGAQYNQGHAAVLGIILLTFTLSAFAAQRYWVGRKVFTTVGGKGDSGVHVTLSRRAKWPALMVAMPWAVFTIVVYGMVMFGGFVEIWGRDHSLTLRHYADAFGMEMTERGMLFTGMAWNSFSTTLYVAAAAAPITAIVGLLTAYILARQRFVGRNMFEFITMLSFATPGTVIGVSYILAFNVPPFEMTGTGLILILSFMSRNMPVGIRAGIASLSQIDRSLDEASQTLGASSLTTMRRVIFPLVRPAVIAALIYSFVSAMTAISAVIFLVSAQYDLATSYIIGRVENGDYGVAIAYSSVLIVVMLAAIGLIQLAVGKRNLRRRSAGASPKTSRVTAEIGVSI
ncbi:MAG: iron ABC transporter permease [Pseudomonadota bacterium]